MKLATLITAAALALGIYSQPFAAETPGIVELTDEDIVMRWPDRVFRPISRNVVVPDNLADKYVVAVAVVTTADLTEAQEGQLETAIEAIVGVDLAHILVGSSQLSVGRLPTDIPAQVGVEGSDYKLQIRVEMGFRGIEETIPALP